MNSDYLTTSPQQMADSSLPWPQSSLLLQSREGGKRVVRSSHKKARCCEAVLHCPYGKSGRFIRQVWDVSIRVHDHEHQALIITCFVLPLPLLSIVRSSILSFPPFLSFSFPILQNSLGLLSLHFLQYYWHWCKQVCTHSCLRRNQR